MDLGLSRLMQEIQERAERIRQEQEGEARKAAEEQRRRLAQEALEATLEAQAAQRRILDRKTPQGVSSEK